MTRKIAVLFILIVAGFMTSCLGPQMVGRNTVNTVYWNELKLERSDYVVLERITETATITYDASKKRKPKIIGENNEFLVVVKSVGPKIESGVLKFGYLTGDIGKTTEVRRRRGVIAYIPVDPEIFARQLAVYRIITQAKAIGADALIEPIISSDVATTGKRINIIKTTVSAKAVIIKTDKSK